MVFFRELENNPKIHVEAQKTQTVKAVISERARRDVSGYTISNFTSEPQTHGMVPTQNTGIN
jgi:hypothetical protein